MTERPILGSIPVITNDWLPVGAFYCHPDTLKLDEEKLKAAIALLRPPTGERPNES